MKFLNLTASNFVWNPQRTALVISWPLSKTKHSKRESNPHRITITVQWDLKLFLLLIILLKSLTKTELRVKNALSVRKKFFVFFIIWLTKHCLSLKTRQLCYRFEMAEYI